MRCIALCLAVAACGSSPSTTIAPRTAPLSPALQPLAWLEGDWTTTHWRAAGGALYGVTLREDHPGFGVSIIDDAAGPGPADGVIRMYTATDGAAFTEWTGKLAPPPATAVSFVQTTGNLPDELHLRREGAVLHMTLQVQDAIVKDDLAASGPDRAVDLEDADRAFSADTGKRGIDGWMAAFAPNAGMLRKGQPVGLDGIREMMAPLLGSGVLAWEPVGSAKLAAIGFTVGTATFTGKDPKDNWRSSYVTIWAKQPNGTWKVRFDTGRPINN